MREVAFTNKRWIVIGIGASLAWTLAKIAIPLFAMQAIDQGIDPYDGQALALWSLGVVVLTIGTGTFTYFRRTAAFAVSLRAEAEVRRRLFDHLQRLYERLNTNGDVVGSVKCPECAHEFEVDLSQVEDGRLGE